MRSKEIFIKFLFSIFFLKKKVLTFQIMFCIFLCQSIREHVPDYAHIILKLTIVEVNLKTRNYKFRLHLQIENKIGHFLKILCKQRA